MSFFEGGKKYTGKKWRFRAAKNTPAKNDVSGRQKNTPAKNDVLGRQKMTFQGGKKVHRQKMTFQGGKKVHRQKMTFQGGKKWRFRAAKKYTGKKWRFRAAKNDVSGRQKSTPAKNDVSGRQKSTPAKNDVSGRQKMTFQGGKKVHRQKMTFQGGKKWRFRAAKNTPAKNWRFRAAKNDVLGRQKKYTGKKWYDIKRMSWNSTKVVPAPKIRYCFQHMFRFFSFKKVTTLHVFLGRDAASDDECDPERQAQIHPELHPLLGGFPSGVPERLHPPRHVQTGAIAAAFLRWQHFENDLKNNSKILLSDKTLQSKMPNRINWIAQISRIAEGWWNFKINVDWQLRNTFLETETRYFCIRSKSCQGSC